MNDIHELLLAYEELDQDERTRVDRHLAQNPGARALLERLRRIDELATTGLEMTGDEALELDAEWPEGIGQEERASLARLRDRLGIAETRRSGAPSYLRQLRLAVIPVLAAMTAILIWAPWSSNGPRLERFQLVRVAETAGLRAGERVVSSGDQLRTGETVVLRVLLQEPARVIVVHVDADGIPALLYPDPAAASIPLLERGSEHVLPPPQGEERWRVTGSTGTETFLLARQGAGDSVPSLRDLEREILEVSAAHPDRARRLAAVDSLLTDRIGAVESIEYEHID